MNKVKKVLLMLLLAGLAIAFLPGAIKVVRESFGQNDVVNCGVFGFSTLLGAMAFSTQRLQFLHVFLHEASHMIASVLSGQSVSELYVSSDGNGHVRTTQTNMFVSLAPYSIASAPIVLLAVASIVKSDIAVAFVSVSGFIFGDHIISVFRDLRAYQPDIQRHGFLLSVCFVSLLNMFSLTVVALLLSRASFPGFESFFVEGGRRIIVAIRMLWAML